MAAKKQAAALRVVAAPSKLKAGTGSRRVKTRFIIIYGPPKSRKTTSVSTLDPARTKWIVSDSNCVGDETQFITNQGVRTFRDMRDGDRVVVLSHTGKWRNAIVRSYGERELFEITLGRGQNIQTVRATADHRWLLDDGSTVPTAKLTTGTKLHKPPHIIRDWSFEEATREEQMSWLQGFIFGDGSASHAHGKEIGSKLRLCGQKARFVDRIASLGFEPTYPPSSEGEPNFYFAKVFKRLPGADTSIEHMTAFVRGWLDADGTRNNRTPASADINPFSGIQVTGQDAIAFVRSAFPMVGAYIVGERDITEPTNFGARLDTTVFFSLVMGFSNSPVAPYNVRTIHRTAQVESVWCLEVEVDASFVLPNGVVTRNCIPTLAALNRLPPDENIYEVQGVPEARTMVDECLDLVEKEGVDALGIDTLVADSGTQFADWHQEDIAKATGQRFLGDNSKNNGWQQFNVEFGQFLDRLAMLARHINVVLICHAKEKVDLSKGEWAGLNLSPQMALKAGRLANWVIYQTCTDKQVDEKVKEDDFIQNIVTERDGTRKAKEVIMHTQPYGCWIASVNAQHLDAEEPGDFRKLLEKEGLL